MRVTVEPEQVGHAQFCWPEHRLVLQLDRPDVSLEQRVADSVADARLRAADWNVVRLRGESIDDDEALVMGIMRLLMQHAACPVGDLELWTSTKSHLPPDIADLA